MPRQQQPKHAQLQAQVACSKHQRCHPSFCVGLWVRTLSQTIRQPTQHMATTHCNSAIRQRCVVLHAIALTATSSVQRRTGATFASNAVRMHHTMHLEYHGSSTSRGTSGSALVLPYDAVHAALLNSHPYSQLAAMKPLCSVASQPVQQQHTFAGRLCCAHQAPYAAANQNYGDATPTATPVHM
jgi:hypothetical protein